MAIQCLVRKVKVNPGFKRAAGLGLFCWSHAADMQAPWGAFIKAKICSALCSRVGMASSSNQPDLGRCLAHK